LTFLISNEEKMTQLFRALLNGYVLFFSILIGFFYPFSAAYAEPKDEYWGINININTKNGCNTDIKIDQPTFVSKIPVMIEDGIFNSRLDPNAGLSAFHYLANLFAVDYFNQTIQQVMESVKSSKCRFSYYYITTDEYGNDEKKPMFAFDFDRETYKKIKWNRFDPNNIRRISKNFTVSEDFNALVQQESIAVLLMLRN